MKFNLKKYKDGDSIGPEVVKYTRVPLITRKRITIDYGKHLTSTKEMYLSFNQGKQAWLISDGVYEWVILDTGERIGVHYTNYHLESEYKSESLIYDTLSSAEKIYGKGRYEYKFKII
jgi:hypothetical protein